MTSRSEEAASDEHDVLGQPIVWLPEVTCESTL